MKSFLSSLKIVSIISSIMLCKIYFWQNSFQKCCSKLILSIFNPPLDPLGQHRSIVSIYTLSELNFSHSKQMLALDTCLIIVKSYKDYINITSHANYKFSFQVIFNHHVDKHVKYATEWGNERNDIKWNRWMSQKW